MKRILIKLKDYKRKYFIYFITMDNYFTVKYLLGLSDGNLPVHKGMRQKRYRSIEKMLDLLDVVNRVGPRFPTEVLHLDPMDRKESILNL